jgi:hypothetical protein
MFSVACPSCSTLKARSKQIQYIISCYVAVRELIVPAVSCSERPYMHLFLVICQMPVIKIKQVFSERFVQIASQIVNEIIQGAMLCIILLSGRQDAKMQSTTYLVYLSRQMNWVIHVPLSFSSSYVPLCL